MRGKSVKQAEAGAACRLGCGEVCLRWGAETSAPIDVPPASSSTAIWSPIPNDTEIGREEALFRRADHRLPA